MVLTLIDGFACHFLGPFKETLAILLVTNSPDQPATVRLLRCNVEVNFLCHILSST